MYLPLEKSIIRCDLENLIIKGPKENTEKEINQEERISNWKIWNKNNLPKMSNP